MNSTVMRNIDNAIDSAIDSVIDSAISSTIGSTIDANKYKMEMIEFCRGQIQPKLTRKSGLLSCRSRNVCR